MKELFQALQKAKEELAGKIEADQEGYHGQPVTSLNKAIEIIMPVFWKHGLDINQYQTCTIAGIPCLQTEVVHLATGQTKISDALLSPKGPGEQALGSAETYVKRRAILTAAGVATDGDPDLSHKQQTRTQPRATSATGTASKSHHVGGLLDKLVPVMNLPAKDGKAAGKYLGKRYRDVPMDELVGTANWFRDKIKNLNKWQMEFISDVEELQSQDDNDFASDERVPF